MSSDHQTIRGVIRYTSDQPDRKGETRGWEFFRISREPDGSRVMHAHVEIYDPPTVWRDLILSLRPDRKPQECSLRLSVGGKHEGTGFMHFSNDEAECLTYKGDGSRIHQRIPLQQPVRWLGAHPVSGDALALYLYDRSQGPGRAFYDGLMLTSPDHRGATGPELYPMAFGLEFVGEEQLKVRAGEFQALHFRFTDTAGQLPEEHPPYDVWCTADDDFIFLRGKVGGYMQTVYELTELKIGGVD